MEGGWGQAGTFSVHPTPSSSRIPPHSTGPAVTEDTRTDLFHPSQDDVRAPPVVHGDLQADPQGPASTGSLSLSRHKLRPPSTRPSGPRARGGSSQPLCSQRPPQLLVCRTGHLHPLHPLAPEQCHPGPRARDPGERELGWESGVCSLVEHTRPKEKPTQDWAHVRWLAGQLPCEHTLAQALTLLALPPPHSPGRASGQEPQGVNSQMGIPTALLPRRQPSTTLGTAPSGASRSVQGPVSEGLLKGCG